jgi:Integrase core domain
MQRSRGLEICESLAEAARPDRAALVVYDMQVGIVRQLPSAPVVVVLAENSIREDIERGRPNRVTLSPMIEVLKTVLCTPLLLFQSRSRLQIEILVLRHQLIVLRRTAPRRARLRAVDRLLFVLLYRLWPGVLDSIAVIQPDTIVRWHRRGFGALWRWKSRLRLGRPAIAKDMRDLIREISRANPLWGAPRIHGELLKLGIDVAQSTVAKYMSRTRRPPSQSWRTFLRNHAEAIASDLFVVPTITFGMLFAFVVLHHGRRQLVHVGVTAHPTAEWISHQISEAFPWDRAPRHLIRDRDGAFDEVFKQRLHAMGIRDRPTAPRSPWQNAYVERLIGSIRRDCLDHLIILDERHLRRLLRDYAEYYKRASQHPSVYVVEEKRFC